MIERIRVCCPESTNPYENLALEHHLMLTVEPGECILSLWRNQRTVVIGRNQNMLRECRVEQLLADGGHPARRLSGGGAVFHDLGNLNFSFLVREPDYDVSRQLSVIISALSAFGLDAKKTGRNDVTVDGRKCSGNAFLREGQAHCHHGTLLISVSSEDMMRYLTPDPGKLASKGVSSVKSRVVNLQELVPELTVDTVRPELIRAFGEVYGLQPEMLPVESLDMEAVHAEAAKLGSPEWLITRDPEFTLQTGREYFSWGSAELAIHSNHGVITEAILYTDALDEHLPERVNEALKGVPCESHALWDALFASGLELPVVEGLLRLITKEL